MGYHDNSQVFNYNCRWISSDLICDSCAPMMFVHVSLTTALPHPRNNNPNISHISIVGLGPTRIRHDPSQCGPSQTIPCCQLSWAVIGPWLSIMHNNYDHHYYHYILMFNIDQPWSTIAITTYCDHYDQNWFYPQVVPRKVLLSFATIFQGDLCFKGLG